MGKHMKSATDIITACGGAGVVAEVLKVSLYTACDWMTRNRIPSKHWKKLVDTYGVDIQDLLSLPSRK